MRYKDAQLETEQDKSTSDFHFLPLARAWCCKTSSYLDRQWKIPTNVHRCLGSHKIKRETELSLFPTLIISVKSCNSFLFR